MIDWNARKVLTEWGTLEAGPIRMACHAPLSTGETVPQGLRLICWGMVTETPTYRDNRDRLFHWYGLGQGFDLLSDAIAVIAFEHRLQDRITADGWKPTAWLDDPKTPSDYALVPAIIASRYLGYSLPNLSNKATRGEIDHFERRGQRLYISVGWVMREKFRSSSKPETFRTECASVK